MPEENAQISSKPATRREKVTRFLLPLAVLVIGLGAGAVVYTSKPPVEEQAAEIKPRTVNTMAVEVSTKPVPATKLCATA